jgi:hypothetical protein
MRQRYGNIRFSAADIHVEGGRLQEQLAPRRIQPQQQLSETDDVHCHMLCDPRYRSSVTGASCLVPSGFANLIVTGVIAADNARFAQAPGLHTSGVAPRARAERGKTAKTADCAQGGQRTDSGKSPHDERRRGL